MEGSSDADDKLALAAEIPKYRDGTCRYHETVLSAQPTLKSAR